MLTINKGCLNDVVEAFSSRDYKSAMFVVTNSSVARDLLHSLNGWEINSKSLSATKDGKKLWFVFDKEHTYGRSFDYMGIIEGFPEKEDFLYYLTRLREVKF